MSVTATWSEGVFKPTGEVKGAVPGKAYRVFSDEELLELTEGIQWLRAAEPPLSSGITMTTPSTISYRRGDIVLVSFPFTDLTFAKRRPALVVSPDIFNENSRFDRLTNPQAGCHGSALGPWSAPTGKVGGTLEKPARSCDRFRS